MSRLPLLRAVIAFYILILLTALVQNPGMSQEKNTFCSGCQPLSTTDILNHFTRRDTISNAIIKAENLVEAVRKAREEGVGPRINITHSHITGALHLAKLSLKKTHEVSLSESTYWGLPEGKLVTVVPNSISIEDSQIDSLHLVAPWKVEIGGIPVVFKKKVKFTATTFNGQSVLKNGIFARGAYFSGAIFKSGVLFYRIKFAGENFWSSNFEGVHYEVASFASASFKEEVSFEYVKFAGHALFDRAAFTGGAYFSDCEFRYSEGRSTAMRLAAKYWRQLGSQRKSDHYFYRHMRAERAQKPFFGRWAEYVLVDLTSKYGMSWKRVLASWAVIIFLSALGYWLSRGLKKGPYPKPDLSPSWFAISLYFSVATFIRFGSGKYEPRNKISKTIASIEALLGAFFIALFVLVFASKFMR